jgi:hypothetical protein
MSHPSFVDETETLPAGQGLFRIGDVLYLEVWAQTSQATGLSSVTTDIEFETGLLRVDGVSHTSTFAQFPTGSVEALLGTIDNLGGSHPPVEPPCGDQVGLAPRWVRVAIIEMSATGIGTTTIQATDSESELFGIAICNIPGNLGLANIEFSVVTVSIGQCLEDVECDDLNSCTVDTCREGSCENAPDGLCGACCNGSGTCDDDVSSSACAADGGAFVGAGTSCLGDGNGDGTDDACATMSNVPAMSQWGLAVLALILLTTQKICFRRPRSKT